MIFSNLKRGERINVYDHISGTIIEYVVYDNDIRYVFAQQTANPVLKRVFRTANGKSLSDTEDILGKVYEPKSNKLCNWRTYR